MAKIIYDTATGVYITLGEGVVAFDTDDYPYEVMQSFYDGMDFTPVVQALPVTDVVTEEREMT